MNKYQATSNQHTDERQSLISHSIDPIPNSGSWRGRALGGRGQQCKNLRLNSEHQRFSEAGLRLDAAKAPRASLMEERRRSERRVRIVFLALQAG